MKNVSDPKRFADHFPLAGVNQICSVGSKVVFAYNVYAEGGMEHYSCLWTVDFVNGDFSRLRIEDQGLQATYDEPFLSDPISRVMMFERNGDQVTIFVV